MASRYQIVCMVVDCGSLKRAADELGYTQSAVSRAVRALERELGTTLIERGKRGVSLTRDGKAYLPYLRQIVTAEAELEGKPGSCWAFVDRYSHCDVYQREPNRVAARDSRLWSPAPGRALYPQAGRLHAQRPVGARWRGRFCFTARGFTAKRVVYHDELWWRCCLSRIR